MTGPERPKPAVDGDVVRAAQVPPVRPQGRSRSHPLIRMQRAAGNRAVASLLGRRAPSPLQRVDCPPAPVAPPGTKAAEDPRFVAVADGTAADARQVSTHPPAEHEARKAAAAAEPPSDDREAQAKAAHAETMGTAKPIGFDKVAFIAAVGAAIAAQRPTTNEDASNLAGSGRAAAIKAEVSGQVKGAQETSAKDISSKAGQAPDPGVAVSKPVTPLPGQPPAPALSAPDPARAIPDRAPAEQTDLRGTECELSGRMAEANVSEEQLARSNEPELAGAVEAKRGAVAHAEAAPAALREQEAGVLASARSGAAQAGRAGVAGMLSTRATQVGQVSNAQSTAKGRDEQERTRIAGELRTIFDRTKKEVDGILTGLDGLVETEFNAGEKAARDAFEANHRQWMQELEDRIGLTQWLVDKFLPTKPEVLAIFTRATAQYEQDMSRAIARVADVVERELNRATQAITKGRDEIRAHVAAQPKELQEVASDAATDIASRFDELDSAVQEKQQGLVQDLADRYNAARQDLDKRVQELQDEHKSWRDKAVDAVDGAIATIKALRDMLTGVLARAAGAVELIVKDPIGFVGNLVNAVKTGVMGFKDKILDYLQKGLKTWLFGNLAAAGIEVPKTFDLRGILQLVLSLLGLTWPAIRARILRFIPEKVLQVLEGTLEVVKILISDGPAGLWKWVQQKIGDFKEMILGQVKEIAVVEIVKAGVLWLFSMLNPASAFVKACKAIVDVIMFFVNNAARISTLVNAVLDSVESIARGGVGKAAELVERALGSAVPVVLGFLASMLGLGNIPAKIRGVLDKVQAPIGKLVDSVVGTVAKVGKNLLARLGRKKKPDDESPEAKADRLAKGMAAAVTAVNKLSGVRLVGAKLIKPVLAVIRLRYRMTSLTTAVEGGKWVVKGVVNPEDTKPTTRAAPDKAQVLAAVAAAEAEKAKAQEAWVNANSPEQDVCASAGGRIFWQGGGSRAGARRSREAGWRYHGAEQSTDKVLGDAQKLAYQHVPGADLGRMTRDSGYLAEIRELLAAKGIFGIPRGHAFDRRKHSAIFEGSAEMTADERGEQHKRPGSEAGVHAEVLAYNLAGQPSAVGVYRLPQCGSCQSLFKSFAQAKGETGFIVVSSSDRIRIFLADGKVRTPEEFEQEFGAGT